MVSLTGSVRPTGAKKHDVALVQAALALIRDKRGKAYLTGTAVVDGVYGPSTQDALLRFVEERVPSHRFETSRSRPRGQFRPVVEVRPGGPVLNALSRSLPTRVRGMRAMFGTDVIYVPTIGGGQVEPVVRFIQQKLPLPDSFAGDAGRFVKAVHDELGLLLEPDVVDSDNAGLPKLVMTIGGTTWLFVRRRHVNRTSPAPEEAVHAVLDRAGHFGRAERVVPGRVCLRAKQRAGDTAAFAARLDRDLLRRWQLSFPPPRSNAVTARYAQILLASAAELFEAAARSPGKVMDAQRARQIEGFAVLMKRLGGPQGKEVLSVLKGVTASDTSAAPMEDAARFIYKEMINNIDSSLARQIRDAPRFEFDLLDADDDLPFLGEKFEKFKEATETGGIWDHKPVVKNLFRGKQWIFDPKSKQRYRFDVWSNIHFGYIGKSLNFTSFELHFGAAVGQVTANFKETILSGNFGDDPLDRKAIDLGIKLWDVEGSGLTFSTFIAQIRQ